jgi:hypothetical protein
MRRWTPGAIMALSAGLVGLAACARPLPSPTGARFGGSSTARPLVARPDFAGWMLAPEGPAGNDARLAPDGSRSFILRGTRWVDHPDGSTERSRQVFLEDDVKALALPPHLGSGFLFYVSAGSSTLLWRSDTWTGELRPLGRVDPPVSEIIAGFDRLYLTSATSYALRAIDAFAGKALDTAPLPPAPAYGDMLFVDAWTGVVLTGIRGALATFDAGESWHPVPTPAPVNELEARLDGGILLVTERGRFELTTEGRLLPLSARGGDAAFRGTNTFTEYGPDAFAAGEPKKNDALLPPVPLGLGRRPLRAALLHGWPDTRTTAVVIDEGVLGRVRLSDGKLLSAQPFAGTGPCRGVALGMGFGFVCGDVRDRTQIYAYARERLELELELDGPYAVRSSGNGGLVIAAGCDAVLKAARSLTATERARPPRTTSPGVMRYCVRQVSGELFDVRVRGEVGTERVAALRDGRVAVLIPPRSSATGRLSLVSSAGTTTTELELDPDAGPGARLVRSGLWLDELGELSDGELGAWVVGAQAFVGVRIDLEGKLRIARVQEGVDETSFSGPAALHLAGAASLRETTDYGFEWRVSALPPAVLAPASGTRPRWPVRGCSSVGCAYDDWLRVGFAGERGVPEPAPPPAPERVVFDGSRFAFWNLSCDVAAAPAHRAAERAPAPVRSLEPPGSSDGRRPLGGVPESSAWLSFRGEPPPGRRTNDVGYDFSTTNENGAYHAYVWGPAAGAWSRRGMWQARVGDRFSAGPPWSTAVSRSPWPDPATAAQAFGLDSSTGVDWWFRFGASDRTGVLQLRVRSESSIHLVERDRAIITLDLSKLPDLGVVTSALPVGDRWYIGATRSEHFQLYRVEADRPELVGTYPVLGRATAQLIGSVQGDELGIWARSQGSGWQVFPLDLQRFEVQPPVHVPVDALGRVPPPCEPGRPGWLAVAGVPLTEASVSESNTHVDFSGKAEGLRTKRLTARVVIDEAGLCVDALAALVDGPGPGELPVEQRAPRRNALPLVVTDPVDERRWAFRCSP